MEKAVLHVYARTRFGRIYLQMSDFSADFLGVQVLGDDIIEPVRQLLGCHFIFFAFCVFTRQVRRDEVAPFRNEAHRPPIAVYGLKSVPGSKLVQVREAVKAYYVCQNRTLQPARARVTACKRALRVFKHVLSEIVHVVPFGEFFDSKKHVRALELLRLVERVKAVSFAGIILKLQFRFTAETAHNMNMYRFPVAMELRHAQIFEAAEVVTKPLAKILESALYFCRVSCVNDSSRKCDRKEVRERVQL